MTWIKRLFTRKKKLYHFNPDYGVRPSDVILDAMKFAGVSETDLWSKTLLEIMTVEQLLLDRIEINYHIARELSKILGSSTEFWITLGKNYFDKNVGRTKTNADY